MFIRLGTFILSFVGIFCFRNEGGITKCKFVLNSVRGGEDCNIILKVDGMKCMGCVSKIESALKVLDSSVRVTLEPPEALFDVQELNMSNVNSLLETLGNYKASVAYVESTYSEVNKVQKYDVKIYRPVIAVFASISLLTFLSLRKSKFDFVIFMRYFMSYYFLIFSTFKILNLSQFRAIFAGYDLLAEKIKVYGYIYPFLEFSLGLLYYTNSIPVTLNVITLLLKTYQTYGIYNVLINKKNIQCACLGGYFRLPMTQISLFEDALMVVMSSVCLLKLLWK